MDTLTFLLRLSHILFGVLWAGTVFFSTLFLIPQLKRLGPSIQNSVMNSLMPILTPVMMLSCIIVLGTGIALTLIVWGSLDTLFTTTSGWILFIGFLSTFSAAVVGFGFMAPTGMRLGKLNSNLQGHDPSPEEMDQLSQLNVRINILDRMNFTLMVIAVGSMALLRYI